MKIFSSASIVALKDALINIYWKKDDLKNFIKVTINNTAILSTIDWDQKKFEIVSELINRMVERKDIYENDLILLIQEVGKVSDFSHLRFWDDAQQTKVKKAKESVKKLREYSKVYFDLKEEDKKVEERKSKAQAKIHKTVSMQLKIEELKSKFLQIAIITDYKKRGYDLEKFLNDLFFTFDLDPKRAFKIAGEQIDGAFTFDNTDYLLEAKWQKEPVNAAHLNVFAGKLSGKLKNTLGLYISMEGFSPECLQVHSPGIKSMILMDGADLNAILEDRISLADLLYRKRRHAAETGDVYLSISKILI